MTVRVAIDLALDRLFDYEVPEALQEKLAVGQLLSVPFGHRTVQGFALAVRESSPVDAFVSNASPRPIRLKPIFGIVDETPFFSTPLLELVKKLSAYTAAPIETMLRAALPAAVLKKNIRPRELLYVEPALAPETNNRQPATNSSPILPTQRQQWLYDQIVRLGGGWLTFICRELETTPATLRVLADKGVIRLAAREKRRDPLGGRRILPTKPLPLNPEQRAALEKVSRIGDGEALRPLLLFGVTGSGKTEVYLQAIARELEAGRGAIVLVPEIALTPQTVQRFASRFGSRVAVLHSALSDGERYDEWHRIRAGAARVVVGPRSAVFAPVKDLGILIVDEEHEPSYKQDETPRYNARDAAVLRGALEGAKVVLGSATPSLETWHNVETGKYGCATMTARAGAGTLPRVRLVDMRGAGAVGYFSRELLDALELRLERSEQSILFLNRRGYARSVVCSACGYVATCPKCDVPYTYHRADDCLRCHVCGGWIPTPATCPGCRQNALTYKGLGTQRAEAALAKCLPRARILRMDADAVRGKNSHDEILGAFRRGEADILLGTQMIAKGLDFPNVTLVGVLNADSSLNLPDFRATERTYQLLAQVAGRAGRAELPGEVIIQTYDPETPVLRQAARGDFRAFATAELADRAAAELPPYAHLALVALQSKDLKQAADWAELYAKSLAKVPKLTVSEAVPSALEKADGWYRWQVVVRSPTVGPIVQAWKWLTGVRPAPKGLRVTLDVDARNLI